MATIPSDVGDLGPRHPGQRRDRSLRRLCRDMSTKACVPLEDVRAGIAAMRACIDSPTSSNRDKSIATRTLAELMDRERLAVELELKVKTAGQVTAGARSLAEWMSETNEDELAQSSGPRVPNAVTDRRPFGEGLE